MTQPHILGPARSGVYRTPEDVAGLRESLRQADGQWIEVDMRGVGSKAELLEKLAHAASLPPDFGRNWDALADCLQDLPASSSAYVLHLRSTSAARAAVGPDWTILLEILEDAAKYWKARGSTFVALIDDAEELAPWR